MVQAFFDYMAKRLRSGLKARRQTLRRTVRNDAKRATLKHAFHSFKKALNAKDKTRALELARTLQALYMKAVKTHLVHRNAANRYISRITRQAHSLAG